MQKSLLSRVRLCVLFLLFLFISQFTFSQCPGCAKGVLTGVTQTPTCADQNVSAGSGTYVSMNVTTGVTYDIGTCNSSFDTQITGYDGTTCKFHNDDNGNLCSGSTASVQWTADFSGVLDVNINRFNCQGHDFTGNSAILDFKISAPTTANAGSDQTVCTSATLAANFPSVGSGSWSVVSGTGTFANSNDNNTTVNGLSTGANEFKWTTNNGGCTTDDNVVITNDIFTTADAGADQTVCTNAATLSANTPTSGTGTWSIVSGTGTFTNANSPITTVTGISATNTYRWTLNNGTCTSSQDDVVIVIDNIPPIPVCQNYTQQLNGAGNGALSGSDIDGGTTDNCSFSLSVAPNAFDCGDVGVHNVTLFVTDDGGNMETCTADVTVEDNIDPSAVCQNTTLVLDSITGIGTIAAGDIDNGSSDACQLSLSLSQSNFDCFDVGTATISLTATDASNNTAQCTALVDVIDNIVPVALCQDITVSLDGAGTAIIQGSDIDNGSSDACPLLPLSVTPNSFICADTGTVTAVLTVEDINNNISTCEADLTIRDNTPPTAQCVDITVQLDATGNADITSADIDNGSTDNCGIVSYLISATSFTCSDVGVNLITLAMVDYPPYPGIESTDDYSECVSAVTVSDATAPTALCQDVTLQLNASGTAILTASQIDNGSNDNCGNGATMVSPDNFDCNHIGSNVVTLTVSDDAGNNGICTATALVEDNILPIAVCTDITVALDGSGNAAVTPADVDNGSNDNCGIQSATVTPNTFTCTEKGDNIVTYSILDFGGNSDACNATVTIVDDLAPVVLCQNVTTQLNASGMAMVLPGDVDNGSYDNCSISSLVLSQEVFDCGHLGENGVVLSAADISGNSTVCMAMIYVEDNISPIALCQDVTIQLSSTGFALVDPATIENGSDDNCGVHELVVTPASFLCDDVGANAVVLDVWDEANNVSTCAATVTVEDVEAPDAVCSDITVVLNASGNAMITANDIVGSPDDNCGIQSTTVSMSSFTCANTGVNVVTYTATDVNGNATQCNANVTVEDNINPVALCAPITIQLAANGTATITSGDIDNGSSDKCGIASLTTSHNSVSCSDVGTITVTLTATDNNGNSNICTTTVTVEDNVAPSAQCQDITVILDSGGNASITTTDVDNGSSDACGISSAVLSVNTFTCADVGGNVVTQTLTDVYGNSSTCVSNVTVVDDILPVALCVDVTVQLDGSGNALITAGDIDGGSSDICGVSINASPLSFGCGDLGGNQAILTVTDGGGNISTCEATVTVNDNELPVITSPCPADVIQDGDNGTCEAIVTWVAPTATDNCAVTDFSPTNANGSTFNLGTTTVIYTATDAAGNAASCQFDVTINDGELPVITDCPANIDNGCASIVAWNLPSASDNCAISTFTSNYASGTFLPVGVTQVIYTAVDIGGNSVTCEFDVTIHNSPIANAGADQTICPGQTAQIGGNPTASGGVGLTYTYTWSDVTGTLDDPTASNPFSTPDATSSYLVFVIDNTTGCSSTDFVTVNVVPAPASGVQVANHVKGSVDSVQGTTSTVLSPIVGKKDFQFWSVGQMGNETGLGAVDMLAGAYLFDGVDKDAGEAFIFPTDSNGNILSAIQTSTSLLNDGVLKKDYYGFSVAGIGDVNNDGHEDIAVGSWKDEVVGGTKDIGSVRVLLMDGNGGVLNDVTIIENVNGFNPDIAMNKKDQFAVVSGIGDLNLDGVPDIAVGAAFDDETDRDAGAVYVLFLTNTGTVSGHTKIVAGDVGGIKKDLFGWSVISAGDIDGDGVQDLVAGATLDDADDRDVGAIYVLFMNTDGTLKGSQKISSGVGGLPSGTVIKKDAFGRSLAALGDVNDDGTPDIMVGATGDDGAVKDVGAVYILYLKADGTVSFFDKISQDDGNFTGVIEKKDFFGNGSTSLGDLNGDCIPEILVGAPLDDEDLALSRPRKDAGAGWIMWLEGKSPEGREAEAQVSNYQPQEPIAIPETIAQPEANYEAAKIVNEPTFSIHPNPTEGELTLSFIGVAESENVKVEVINLFGRVVWEKETTTSSTSRFDLSALPAGQYLVGVKADTWKISKRLTLSN